MPLQQDMINGSCGKTDGKKDENYVIKLVTKRRMEGTAEQDSAVREKGTKVCIQKQSVEARGLCGGTRQIKGEVGLPGPS
mmetsp:Transcript_50921/g.100081  ORF Transcript_50921/g.100081 Transcript_50921/m.100081 type:complete len:80 (-) Transcript_50921:125-364(-)